MRCCRRRGQWNDAGRPGPGPGPGRPESGIRPKTGCLQASDSEQEKIRSCRPSGPTALRAKQGARRSESREAKSAHGPSWTLSRHLETTDLPRRHRGPSPGAGATQASAARRSIPRSGLGPHRCSGCGGLPPTSLPHSSSSPEWTRSARQGGMAAPGRARIRQGLRPGTDRVDLSLLIRDATKRAAGDPQRRRVSRRLYEPEQGSLIRIQDPYSKQHGGPGSAASSPGGWWRWRCPGRGPGGP